VKAAQDALFAEHHQRGAESPEAAHDVERQHRAQEEAHRLRNTFGENAAVQEKKAQRHDHAEKEEHLVAQRQAHTGSGEGR